MTNPIIETDLAEILKEIRLDQKQLLNEVTELKVGQARIEGKIEALDTKVEQLDKRVSNQEFASRGILIGIVVIILGGAAKLFGVVGNP
jgi:hypothetical protein